MLLSQYPVKVEFLCLLPMLARRLAARGQFAYLWLNGQDPWAGYAKQQRNSEQRLGFPLPRFS